MADDVLKGAMDKVKDLAGKAGDAVTNAAEKVTHQDLNHDGTVAGAEPGTEGDSIIDKAGDAIVNTAEKVTNRDLNNDGTIGGE